MADLDNLLGALPSGLREPLVSEYKKLTQNYMEHRWEPAELGAGKICEIVYSIIKGHIDGNYPSSPTKPRNMVLACRQLENESSLPRSFQILIPRMLPPLYEIRNNRGVGHVGGDLDANSIDATLMFTMVNWIMAELVRVFHTEDISVAQRTVDALGQRHIPLIWDADGIKKILSPKMSLRDQALLLTSSREGGATLDQLMEWTESKNKTYFKKLLRNLHKEKLVHYDETGNTVTLLPGGGNEVSRIVEQHTKT